MKKSGVFLSDFLFKSLLPQVRAQDNLGVHQIGPLGMLRAVFSSQITNLSHIQKQG
jgi:hypothetical protein